MRNLVEFAESLLERNSIETFVFVICHLSDDDIKNIIYGK